MLRTIGNLLALVALVFITGMHFAILQGIASARMVVDYSRDTSLSEGLSKTMDGEHPCSMCLKIRKGQGEEKKKSESIGYSQKKSEAAILLTSAQIPLPTLSNIGYESYSDSANAHMEPPALRPPRTV